MLGGNAEEMRRKWKQNSEGREEMRGHEGSVCMAGGNEEEI